MRIPIAASCDSVRCALAIAPAIRSWRSRARRSCSRWCASSASRSLSACRSSACSESRFRASLRIPTAASCDSVRCALAIAPAIRSWRSRARRSCSRWCASSASRSLSACRSSACSESRFRASLRIPIAASCDSVRCALAIAPATRSWRSRARRSCSRWCVSSASRSLSACRSSACSESRFRASWRIPIAASCDSVRCALAIAPAIRSCAPGRDAPAHAGAPAAPLVL